MKIKFFSDYEVSEKLLNRFKDNYHVYDNALSFTIEDDYDYAVVFNSTLESISPAAKIITVIQEPSFSEAHQYKTFLTNSDYIIIHDPALFESVYRVKLGGEVIASPSFMFYDDKIDQSFYYGLEKVIKQKKLSMIVSGHYFSTGNYRKRIKVLVDILNSDLDIDIYGRGLNIKDERYKGELEYKYPGLVAYEYSIAIENSSEKNYVSEKFFDCVLCNTTPIYNGAPNISEIYDSNYFRLIDLESLDIVGDIRKIIEQPAPGVGPNKDIYLKKYNLYSKLKEIILR